MKKLYTIGNGFDLAHGLHTDYWTFRTYIEQHYPEFLIAFEKRYDIEQLDHTEPWYTIEDQKRWNQAVNKALWSSFEDSMGQPNTTEMLSFSTSVLNNMYLDGGNICIQDTMDAYWKKQFGFIHLLQDYLKEWVEQIDVETVRPRKNMLIRDEEDYFLNFNYTDVLERVYKMKRVIHIHGSVERVSDIPPMIGHCNKTEIEQHRQWAREANAECNEGEASIQNAIADYLDAILKDTNSIIDYHHSFFHSLNNIEQIVVIGWSAGSADIPYLLKIKECVSRDTSWVVYWYDDEALFRLKKVLDEVEINGIYTVEYLQTDTFWDSAQ